MTTNNNAFSLIHWRRRPEGESEYSRLSMEYRMASVVRSRIGCRVRLELIWGGWRGIRGGILGRSDEREER